MVKENHVDALKSCITDALTKCASLLGIGHQVFKGEVVSQEKPKRQKKKAPKEQVEKEAEQQRDPSCISDKQLKLIWARSMEIWPDKADCKAELEDIMQRVYNIESGSIRELKWKHMDDMLALLEQKKREAEAF